VAEDEFGILSVQRERTAYDDFARQVARLIQYVVNSGPVHGQQKDIHSLRGLARCAGPRVATGVAGEPVQLLFAAGVAESDFVAGTREKRAEFAAHQS